MALFNNANEPSRVRRHTAPEKLALIDEQIEASIRFYATQPEHVITRRIEELDREWSIERWLDTNASILTLSGAVLGLTVNRKWFAMSATITAFLFQHATTGWCPPVPIFRGLGVRTRGEIDREKFALKALRGDFKNIQMPEQSENTIAPQVLHAANA
jgi:hypothetical protein